MLRLWGHWSSRKDMFMRDNGKTMRETEEGFNNGKTGPSMKDTGRTMLLSAMVD